MADGAIIYAIYANHSRYGYMDVGEIILNRPEDLFHYLSVRKFFDVIVGLLIPYISYNSLAVNFSLFCRMIYSFFKSIVDTAPQGMGYSFPQVSPHP